MFAARAKTLSAALLALWLAGPAVAQTELPPLSHGLTEMPAGTTAPALRLPDLDGAMTDLAALRGKVVVVNFWATWCPPCRREMPSLARLARAIDSDKLVVLAVDVGEGVDTVFPFLGTLETFPDFPILLDKDAASLKPWGVRGLPTTYVIASDGSIVYRAVGGREFDHADVVGRLRRLMPKSNH
jgi:thiol-disulfide isomerase/thioredoxin